MEQTISETKTQLRIFTPVGMLGQGFNEQTFWRAIGNGVDAIILDSGSTDGGPGKLALGETSVPRARYERDLGILLKACHSHRIPILIGSAGGDGEDHHVDMFLDIISTIVSANGYRSMKVVSILSEIPQELVKDKLHTGLISPCGAGVPQLLDHDIESATRIVAQMGHEPYVKAMIDNPDFDIIIGGRAYDPAPYAAYCVYKGFTDMGTNYAMGKIMECGALCSTPKSREALAIVHHDSFDVMPLDPNSRCTPLSVAAHFLYEKTRPDILLGPGGALLLTDTTYEQVDDRTIRVRGARFEPEKPGQHTVKLEGARKSGYHTICIGAIRDPILLSQVDSFIALVEKNVQIRAGHINYELAIHRYGQKGVMGALEPEPTTIPKELGICIQARAPTQAEANYVVSTTKFFFVHSSYPNQVATAGNFAWPFTTAEIPMGPLAEFCIYHIMHNVDPLELFPIKPHLIEGSGTWQPGPGPSNGATPNEIEPDPKHNATPTQDKINGLHPPPAYTLGPPPPPGTTYLGTLASVLRSKNAGPYELTFDVMFSSHSIYDLVKNSGILSRETIARLYHIEAADVVACLFWDPALAFKATIVRPRVSGGFGESDTHGSQQHVPLMYLPVPVENVPRGGGPGTADTSVGEKLGNGHIA